MQRDETEIAQPLLAEDESLSSTNPPIRWSTISKRSELEACIQTLERIKLHNQAKRTSVPIGTGIFAILSLFAGAIRIYQLTQQQHSQFLNAEKESLSQYNSSTNCSSTFPIQENICQPPTYDFNEDSLYAVYSHLKWCLNSQQDICNETDPIQNYFFLLNYCPFPLLENICDFSYIQSKITQIQQQISQMNNLNILFTFCMAFAAELCAVLAKLNSDILSAKQTTIEVAAITCAIFILLTVLIPVLVKKKNTIGQLPHQLGTQIMDIARKNHVEIHGEARIDDVITALKLKRQFAFVTDLVYDRHTFFAGIPDDVKRMVLNYFHEDAPLRPGQSSV